MCKKNNSNINCESAIGQHLIANPECAKTYTDDNFRIIGQARSSFHLSVLESVYIKTQNPANRTGLVDRQHSLECRRKPLQNKIVFIVYLYAENEKLASLTMLEQFERNVMFLLQAILISQEL